MILTTVIGVSANIVSLILWLPQAITTWKNRENSRALKGISLGTQILSIMNTCLWCMYGLMTHDLWLPMGYDFNFTFRALDNCIKAKSKINGEEN